MKTFKDSPLICSKCKTKEIILTEIVEMLEQTNSFGMDLSEPPKFNCEKTFRKNGSNLLQKHSWKNI